MVPWLSVGKRSAERMTKSEESDLLMMVGVVLLHTKASTGYRRIITTNLYSFRVLCRKEPWRSFFIGV
jgi:hypothetical protein